MITLVSDQPCGPYADEMELFGRLAGLWRTSIAYFPADGSPPRMAEGDWEFGYALEGRAVIDVWQIPSRETLAGADRAPDQECGLCVRIWDPRLQLWRFTFHSTARTLVIHMYARQIGTEIVMERAEASQLARWIFSGIRTDSFEWRSERSLDGGRTWRVEQEVHATRSRP